MEEHLKKAIKQMKNGDEKGFNEVYSQTYNRVYFRAKQIMKKEEDAQDLTQIVFVEAYKCINSLQSPEALYSWLDGITYRQGMKIFRKQKDVLLTEEAEGLFDTLENNDITTVPELTVDQKATSEIIRGIMEELPELQKTAVVMFYYDGLKVEQIADVMECSANTIKSRLNYARKYLKDRVVEKEKKEGYRLHTLVPPVLWYAIKTISDKTTLTAQSAQEVYSGACSTVGLQATAITVTTGAGIGASAGVGASSAGASSTVGVVVGETAKAASIGAKFAALSTGVKTLIIAGTVTALGIGAVEAVNLVNANKTDEIEVNASDSNHYSDLMMQNDERVLEDDLSKYLKIYVYEDYSRILDATKLSDTEYCFYAKDLQEHFEMDENVFLVSYLPDNIGLSFVDIVMPHDNFGNIPSTINEHEVINFKLQTDSDIFITIDYMENISFEKNNPRTDNQAELESEAGTVEQMETAEVQEFELTEGAERQISAFVAAAYECKYSSIDGWKIYSMTPDECLFFVNEYIWMVNFAEEGSSNPLDLPYEWSSEKITQQEVAEFFKFGLGIEIPSDYSYFCETEFYYIRITNGTMEMEVDNRTVQIAGGNVEVISQDENGIVLSGTFLNYDYDGEITEYQFTVKGVPSGNSDVFGGLTITDISVSE